MVCPMETIKTIKTPDLGTTMQNLSAACDDLSRRALERLDAAIAARLVAGTRPFFACRLGPLKVRVLVETESASLAIAEFADTEIPPAFDAAVAGFVTLMLERLSADRA